MKNSLNRAALFDMTFLMLVYSTQCFGIEVIKNAMKKQPNDFIRRWINDFMLESSNSNKDLFTVDNNVDNLMQQLHNGDLRTQVVKWQNVCCRLVTLAMTEMINPKKVRAQVAMDFTKN